MSLTPKFPTPTRMQVHHVPNVLPPSHARDDYDFDYPDGTWGPIRINAMLVPEAFVDLPPLVWCRRHGWEREILPVEDVFEAEAAGVKAWGWRCPTCTRTRHEPRFTQHSATRSLEAHIQDKHANVRPFRLHGGVRTGGAA